MNSRVRFEAYALTAVAGAVDAIGVLQLSGLFVAHMSGNSAALGAAFGQGDWAVAMPHLFAIPAFLCGLVLGYFVILPHPTPRRCALLLLTEAGLLALFAALLLADGSPDPHRLSYFGVALLPLVAMGLQNATLREIGRDPFPTTYVTGTIDTLGKSIVALLRQRSRETFTTATLAASILLVYIAGAILGGFGLRLVGPLVLVLPVLFLCGLAAYFRANPDGAAG